MSDIPERTYQFALRIVNVATALPKTEPGRTLARQLLRSGTSIGANVSEAQNAFTKKEFTYMMNIARREAGETSYWLRLVADATLVKPALLTDIRTECDELVRLLSSVVKKSRRRGKQP